MLVNSFAVQEVADYVKQQLESGNSISEDLLTLDP